MYNNACIHELSFLSSGLTGGKDIWIGGNDGQKDRTWSWVGTSLVWGYSKWDRGTEKKEFCFFLVV